MDDTNGLITYCSTTSTFNGDVSTWDVSSVTDMNSMFQYAKAFNQPLAAWDVSSVTDMEYMFKNAKAFNQVLCWDMSGVTNTDYMFTDSGTTYVTAFYSPTCPFTPITDSASLRTTIRAWCDDSAAAEEYGYGDVSTWYVNTRLCEYCGT